jgi:HEAT repeat protein
MDVAIGKRLLPLICCLLTAAGGCAESGSWFHSEKPEAIPGVVSPTKRIQDLRDVAAGAPSKSPAEKQQLAGKLAVEIQREPDPLIRTEIIRTLGELPSPAADAILRVAVNDPGNDVRWAACEAWAKRGNAEAAAVLAGALNSDIDHDVRIAAARALGQTHDPRAITALGGVLDDKDPAMQYIAVLSLRQITGQDLGTDVNKWREYLQSGKLRPAPSAAETASRWLHPF